MIKNKVYVGSFNNDVKNKLQEKALKYLSENKGEKFYYLLPNGDLLKKYRKEFINKVEGTFEINLFTFDDVVNEVIESNFYKSINYSMKSIIIRNVLSNLDTDGKLVYYKGLVSMRGFTETCINIIREIKRSLITPDIFLEKCPGTSFYKEIGLIYKEYENILQKYSLTDREGDYLKCIEILKDKKNFLENLDFIIIDEFYDFRPIEMEIIKELANKDIDIYINIPFGKGSENEIISKSIESLIAIDFDIEYIDSKTKNIFEDLGSKLFSLNEDKYKTIQDIELIKSPSSYIELKKIFREVKQKLYEGVKLEDIGVVILSDNYMDNLFKISKEENFPLSISKKTSMNLLPLIKEFCSIIKCKVSGGAKEDLVNRIKSNYFPNSNRELKDEIEYILRGLNFKDIDDLQTLLENEKSIKIPSDYIDIIQEFAEAIRVENANISDADSLCNYNKLFLDILNKYELEQSILNSYKVINDYEIFHRDLSTIEKLRELLIKMDEASIILEEITIEEYSQVLEDYLLEEEIVEIQENINGLRILSPINARGFSFKQLFIAGLSQDEYPQLKNNSFFLSEDNLKVLKTIGLDFKSYNERLSNESLKFARLISSCTEKLYISYNENSQEESTNIPSMFLDEILSKIDGNKIEEKISFTSLDMDYLINSDINTVSCEKDFTKTLLNKYYYNSEVDDYIYLHNSLYKNKLNHINKITNIENMRLANDFNEYKGLLKDDKIHALINSENKNMTYSISYLEAYRKCPYFFLLNNYFKVEEMGREIEDFSPIDIGTIYHEVLNNYYNNYKSELSNSSNIFQVENTSQFLKELVLKYSEKAGYNRTSNKDLLIIENIYIRLYDFIKADIKRIKSSSDHIIPWGFEIEFGMDKSKPFQLEINNKKINLRGKIDRIDKLANDDKYLLIDYKSSAYGKKDITSIEDGISLQLPVYIMSQKDKNVVAGLYSTISDGEIFTAMGIVDQVSCVNKRQKGAIEKEKWDEILENTKEVVYNILEDINTGNFSVNPLECSSYCIYKDICRYEKILEVE